MSGKTLKFEDGAVQFRQRLIVSILSNRPILIRNIRCDDLDQPGLRDYEASFLRLLDRMTNGSHVEINTTGTQLRFKPGILLGGDVEHDCPVPEKDHNPNNTDDDPLHRARGIGWFLEGILPLAMFGKEHLHLTLRGITDGTCDMDPSPDYLQKSILPLLSHFGVGIHEDEAAPPSIRVVKRGASPGGGGQLEFYCPIVKELVPLNLLDPGKFKRVRGNAITCKVPPSSAARVAHSAKGLLHRLLPDVWIHTDVHSSKTCGPSPGLGLILTAETTTGVVMTAECCMDPTQPRGQELPEDIGTRGAAMLLEEIRRGGCVDTSAQSLALMLMCLGPEDVARIRMGTLSQYTISSLRLFKQALDVEFKIVADHETKTVILSCLGNGYRNMAKASS